MSLSHRGMPSLCASEGNAVQRALVDGGEAETERVAFTVFHLTHLGVVAEVVAAFHELVRLYGKSLLFAEAAWVLEAFVLLVTLLTICRMTVSFWRR